MENNFFIKYPLICLSALNAETITYPIDSTKTRMQISSNSSFFNIFKTNFNKGNLYNGLKYAIGRQFVYNGSRMILYENIKGERNTIFAKSFSALLAGAIGQTLASPFDLLKIRSINKNSNKINNFYRGVIPNVLRASSNSLGYLASYDITKNNLIKLRGKEDIVTYSLSSLVSGLSSTILCTPFDNLKSKIMSGNKYNGTYDCFKKTIKNNGIKSLYVGFLPNWARSGPWHFIFWNSYELYSKLFNIKTI